MAGRSSWVSELADMALIAFVKIIAEIHKNPKVLKYKDHPGLNQRMPGYAVKMGFGLHRGWAIEGAIGSEYKIDASYLSPNVNMASRLEAATKQFGVPLLVSNSIYGICSPITKSKLRKIDRVTVKGSKEPIELFTVDLDPYLLKPSEETEADPDVKRARVLARMRKEALRKKAISGEYHIHNLWNDDEDLSVMRSNVTQKFTKIFAKGLKSYFDGDWEQAKLKFIKGQMVKGQPDGPSRTLLEFMQTEGGKAPDFWPGYRELTDK